jgi:hypothetical protein
MESINSRIPKHFLESKASEPKPKQKSKYSLIDKDIDGDLDEVTVNPETFKFREYFKELYFHGCPSVKQDAFFIYMGRLLRLMVLLMVYNRLHRMYLDYTDTKDRSNKVDAHNSFKDLFYSTEFSFQSKFGEILSDISKI